MQLGFATKPARAGHGRRSRAPLRCGRLRSIFVLAGIGLAQPSCGQPDAATPKTERAREQDAGARSSASATDAATAADGEAVAALAPPKFVCDESQGFGSAPLRRLTMTQYRNTVRDLVRWALLDTSAADRLLLAAELDAVPEDRREPTPRDPHGSYRRLDQAVGQTHVEATFRVASKLGGLLAADEQRETVVGSCAVDDDATNDEECLLDFLQRFGARALRRPLDEDDVSFYRAVYGGGGSTADSAAYADVISVMLSSPEFLYFVEHGTEEIPDEPGTYQLSAYELASRLSYHFWQTLPDDQLWRTAQDGSLLSPAVLSREVERLLDDPRTRATMAELFSDWLRLDEIPAFDALAQDPAYAAFAGPDLPGPELRQQVIDEALDMLAYFTWTDPAGLEALFTSPQSFARGEALSDLYGSEPWDGSSEPPTLPGERPGLLTRAWFLASNTATSRPILRGVLLRKRLLCDELSPPPQNANLTPPAATSDQTTREAIEALTEQPGSSCAGCHATLINPLGYAFEGFDALGRLRVEQQLFSEDGEAAGALPVDTRSVPQVSLGDMRETAGPHDLTELLLQSGKLEACLARHYFRFTFARYEDAARDGCALERLRARLAESGKIRDLLKEAALLPALARRRFEP